jgi:nucleotide-binding universal stress UspA family protein
MYSNILVPVDLNEQSSWKRALPVAVEYCKAFAARLHVMTVVPDLRGTLEAQLYFPPDYEEKVQAEAEKQLQALIKKQVPKGVVVQHSVAVGTVYDEIVKAARRNKADLIIMASHRPAVQDYLIGPNAARVIRHFDRSILVVRD